MFRRRGAKRGYLRGVVAPPPVGSHLRRRIEHAVRRVGLDVRRIGPHTRLELRRAQLLADGEYDLVLDVGANRGGYGSQLRQYGYQGSIFSFEPLAQPFS